MEINCKAGIIFFNLYLSKSRKTLEMAQRMVNNQNERKKIKLTITECHMNCQLYVARDQKLTIKLSNL